jgi:chemotaxis protein methyltransferase CheR
VLIYFDIPTKKAILARARQVLAPDGYLFLGGAETTLNVDERFERLPACPVTVYRQVAAK